MPTDRGSAPQKGWVLVTGVSSGIGRRIAQDLLAHGYGVFGSVRRIDDAAGLAAAGGSRFVPLVFDVTDEVAVAQAAREVDLKTGPSGLAALVNNAGMNISGPFMDQPMEQVRRIFEVNLFGLLMVTRAFLPLLGAEAGGRRNPGRIVNIGSVSGGFAVPFMGAYAASKHALEAYAQAMRRELAIYGIEVSTIEPNFIRSEIYRKAAADARANAYETSPFGAAMAQFNASLAASESRARPASLVSKAVVSALTARRPRPRYPLDPAWYLGVHLPDRLFDRLILRMTGLGPLLRRRAG